MKRKEVGILYSNYKRLSVQWNEDKGAFTIFHDDIGIAARDVHLKRITGLDGSVYELGDYDRSVSARSNGLQISYSGKRCGRRSFSISITLTDDGAKIFVSGDGGADYCLSGWLPVGGGKNRMAVRLDGKDDILRAAVGPATLPGCRGVFAPETDAAVTMDGLGIVRILYDWEKENFAFEYHTMHRDYAGELHLRIRESLYKNAFHLDYKPMGPAAAGGPPVGWMSWYAVEFREGEDTVLENARFQKEKLAAWGANTVWVDWLWCHRDFTGLEHPGTDIFHPAADAYPNGLKAVADEIKALGFRPALWFGITCDAAYNEVMQAHPDMVIAQQPSWCGQYFMDPSHPAFLEEVLPRMARQVKEWGFEAVKWDIMNTTASMCDANREKIRNQNLSTRGIMKNAFRVGRQLLGEDTYMLCCTGRTERSLDFAVGSFDAVRIGGDLFGFDVFIHSVVDRLYEIYMLNGVTIYCDPDCVILREQFNTYRQAVTRATFVSLLGLPFTLGDHLPELPGERLEILRKCIPPLPARPFEIRRIRRQSQQSLLHLRIEKRYGAWDLLDVYNLADEAAQYRLSFAAELQKEAAEEYHAYDFWRGEYLGILSGEYAFDLEPFESRVIALHPVLARPQVISTTRHVSQGALEMEHLQWDEAAGCLSGRSVVPTQEAYGLIVTAPFPWRPRDSAEQIAQRVWRIVMQPEHREFEWEIHFEKETETQAIFCREA